MNILIRRRTTGIGALLALSASIGIAGPIIIDGTDANDHGSAPGGVNANGWEYMQKALQNIAGQVGNGNKIVVDLGTTGGQAGTAINSAFGLSTLVGSGWTLIHVDGAANITTFLTGGTVSGVSLATAGLLYLPTSANSSGDMTAAELAAINANAAAMASFVGGYGNPSAGGGLFSMAESGTGAYGWLSTLIPGLIYTDIGSGGVNTDITLTAAGMAAFPGLTNAEMAGADPWHGYFSGNLGSLSVLGTALQGSVSRNVIIGGGAGTVISAPDGGATLALLGFALTGLAAVRRKLRI